MDLQREEHLQWFLKLLLEYNIFHASFTLKTSKAKKLRHHLQDHVLHFYLKPAQTQAPILSLSFYLHKYID